MAERDPEKLLFDLGDLYFIRVFHGVISRVPEIRATYPETHFVRKTICDAQHLP